jgi:Fe-S-cluster containining protein
MNRAERKRQSKDDERTLARGLDPQSQHPEPVAAMARQMSALFERARRDRNIDMPVKYLFSTAEATLGGLKDIRLACAKGCAHCCHIWVSATAPEVLYVAKLIRRRRDSQAVDRVRAAFQFTRSYSFSVRALHPAPCPMLNVGEQACTVYESRPLACRFTASPDAGVCERSFRQLTREAVPVPQRYLRGRGSYELATVMALKHAGLPHYFYEYNAALDRALAREDAEKAWLGGEDIFADVRRDPHDVLEDGPVPQLYRLAFG